MNRYPLRWPLWAGAFLGLAVLAGAGETPPRRLPQADARTFFESKIRPVLAGTCLKCHGGKKIKGGLQLDSRAAMLEGGDHGPALVPGSPDKSLLIQALRHAHKEVKMPPGKRLPEAVVKDFAAWVKDGAFWPKGVKLATPSSRTGQPWAFTPLANVEPPSDPDGWSANPIDRFIQARLRPRRLQPAGPADKYTLIRRATFDLLGLPPTPEEVDAFLADRSPHAWARLVDRLLASPHHGERWGRHWLDVARYADTGGFEADPRYQGAWRYRDYVVRSLNADKPFDRFIQEQVAGDELWPDRVEAVRATGFYCVGPVLGESAMVSNQLEYEWLTDAADTTGAAFLALTLGCARCHDHKYDPLSQKDYFALQAVFAASDRPYPDKVRLLRIKALNGLLSDAPVPKKFLSDPRCTVRTEGQEGFRLFHRPRPLTVHRLHRGELGKDREVMQPAIPGALRIPREGQAPAEPPAKARREPRPPRPSAKSVFADVPAGKRRAALARWLTARDNPLTARVLVNRVWAWHFGQGIVRTPNDFGAQGEPPTHPELLDWLARDFMDHGWSLKHLHRRILLSRTYQMASVARGAGLRVDPKNRLLWHYPRRRLEGEAIRDSLLTCAGTLNRKAFGPPVVPPLGRQELTGLFDAKQKWPVTRDVNEHARRSVYLLVRRTFVYPLFAAFDPPEVMASCPRRVATIVPTQALTLLNSPLARAQSRAFARRLHRECGDRPEKIVARAWQLAYGRPITPAETERALAFLQKRDTALADLCLALFNTNEFVYLD
jgi:hypothetical protein